MRPSERRRKQSKLSWWTSGRQRWLRDCNQESLTLRLKRMGKWRRRIQWVVNPKVGGKEPRAQGTVFRQRVCIATIALIIHDNQAAAMLRRTYAV